MANGAPSATLTVNHGLNAVKSKVQKFFGARTGRQEIHAELFRLSRSTRAPRATSSAPLRVTSFAWSEAAEASRVALMELTPKQLCNCEQLAAHGRNSLRASYRKRAKRHHRHRITAQEASSIPLPKRLTTLKAIAGAGSRPRLG